MNSNSNMDKEREALIKQLNLVVCICKGIRLNQVLPAIKECDDIQSVHDSCGSGTGGCAGKRCTPRIATLLEKKKNLK